MTIPLLIGLAVLCGCLLAASDRAAGDAHAAEVERAEREAWGAEFERAKQMKQTPKAIENPYRYDTGSRRWKLYQCPSDARNVEFADTDELVRRLTGVV